MQFIDNCLMLDGVKRMNRAVFLDRDGTINKDTGYVGNPDDLELLPGVAEAIRKMNEAGYLVIVISNQSGVARGYFGIDDVEKVNARLNEMLEEADAHIDAFYYCPHLVSGTIPEFAVDCDCRKPKSGMFKQAISDFNLDPVQCFACGDKDRDVVALEELGIPKAHLKVVQSNIDYTLLEWEFVRDIIADI